MLWVLGSSEEVWIFKLFHGLERKTTVLGGHRFFLSDVTDKTGGSAFWASYSRANVCRVRV